jgi:hypothetical protein
LRGYTSRMEDRRRVYPREDRLRHPRGTVGLREGESEAIDRAKHLGNERVLPAREKGLRPA